MSLLPSFTPAILALADGTVFKGQSIGADGVTSGEVVFNTAMSGYQEILTDPSYCRQIVTLTYPHIGNTGCNAEDFESNANYAAGLIIRDLPRRASSWRCEDDLDSYLKKHGIVDSGDALTSGIGAMSDARMASFFSKMVRAGVIKGLSAAAGSTVSSGETLCEIVDPE